MCLLKRKMNTLLLENVRLLLKCLNDIKAWMALNFLNFNDKRTEVTDLLIVLSR